MKISARNQLAGTVRVTEGAVMTEVVVELDGGRGGRRRHHGRISSATRG